MGEERRRDSTNVVIRNRAGQVLLFHRDDKPGIPYPGFYDALGGVVDDGETPEEGAIREALEEGGVVLDPAHLKLVVKYDWPEPKQQTEWTLPLHEAGGSEHHGVGAHRGSGDRVAHAGGDRRFRRIRRQDHAAHAARADSPADRTSVAIPRRDLRRAQEVPKRQP